MTSFAHIEPVDTFEESTHTYYRNAMKVPSFSEIMSSLGFNSHLDKIPSHIVERKARLGSAVDVACGLSDIGQLDEESVHEAVRPFLDGYLKFKSEHKVEWFESQQFHIIDHQGNLYGITPDRIGLIDDDLKYSVMEIKCTYGKPKKIHQIQTAAQGGCIYPKNDLNTFHTRRVLYLDGKGGYDLVEHKDHSHDLTVWRQALATYYNKLEYCK
jgi:hypothetical protein